MHAPKAPPSRLRVDERFMAQAIDLARTACGRTHPNPLVGCVIVDGDQVIGRGYHARAGADHAEIAALIDTSQSPRGCTLYVNHEPCCHFGRTPPCTDSIIKAGISRVVIGTIDPDPRVHGGGIARLQDAGIEVVCGVLEKESQKLNAPFFKFIQQGLPWVAAKWAMSLDGKIATRSGNSRWITGPAARTRAHELRNTHDAILVAKTTLLRDNPRLTCRLKEGRDPARFVIDARLEAPADHQIFNLDSEASTTVFTTESADPTRRQALADRGVDLVDLPLDERGWLDTTALLRAIAARDFMSLLVEGGGALLGNLFDLHHIDYAFAFIAPRVIGGADAPSPLKGRGISTMSNAFALIDPLVEHLGEDLLLHGPLRAPEPCESSSEASSEQAT